MNLEEDKIKIGDMQLQNKRSMYAYLEIEIDSTNEWNILRKSFDKDDSYSKIEKINEEKAELIKRQIIQWQKKAEKYDRLVKKIEELIKSKELVRTSRYSPYHDDYITTEELSSLTEEK